MRITESQRDQLSKMAKSHNGKLTISIISFLNLRESFSPLMTRGLVEVYKKAAEPHHKVTLRVTKAGREYLKRY